LTIWSTARNVAKLRPIGRMRLRTRSMAPVHGLSRSTTPFIPMLKPVTDHSGWIFQTTSGARATSTRTVVSTQLAGLSRHAVAASWRR
jgi:hypothetical protein